MTRLIPSAVLAACAMLAASCAPTSESAAAGEASAGPERQCFSTNLVRNFRSDGNAQVYLRASDNRVYLLSTNGGCQELDFANRLAIVPDGLAGTRICTGDRVRIVLPGPNPALSTCRARVDRVLTDEEVAALPSAHRP